MTRLAGIGVRKDFPVSTTRGRIGVIEHRDGTIDLIVGNAGNSARVELIPLSAEEAAVLADLLGAPQLVNRPDDEHRGCDEAVTRHVPVHR